MMTSLNSILFNIFSIKKGHMIIIIMALTLFIILLPVICGRSFQELDEALIAKAIISPQAQKSYGILMVSTVPLMIDTLLDYDLIYDKVKYKTYLFGRVPLALTGFLVGVQVFVLSDTPSIFNITKNMAGTYFLSFTCFKVVLLSSNMFILTSTKPTVFSGLLSTLLTLLVCSIVIIRFNTPNSTPSFQLLSSIAACVISIPIGCTLVYWGYKWIKMTKYITVEDYTCLLYIFIYLLCLFGSYANIMCTYFKNGKVADFSSYSGDGLALTNYMYVFVFTMLTIAPGRIARFEAVTHLVSLYERILLVY